MEAERWKLKELESAKNQNTIKKINTAFVGVISRVHMAEEMISNFKESVIKNFKRKQKLPKVKKQRRKKNNNT